MLTPFFAIAYRWRGGRRCRTALGTLLVLSLSFLFGTGLPAPHSAAASQVPAASSNTLGELDTLKTYTPEQLRAALATLNDENARKLLLAAIDQLAMGVSAKETDVAGQTGIAAFMHHLETLFTRIPPRLKAVSKGVTELPAETGRVFDPLMKGTGAGRLSLLLLGVIVLLSASYGVERLLRRTTLQFVDHLKMPMLGGMAKFGGVILAALSDLLSIMVFTVTAVVLFLVFFDSGSLIRHVYGPLLAMIVMGRLGMLLLEMICAPRHKALRLLPMEDAGAQYLYCSLSMITWVLVVGIILSKWFQRIGITPDSYLLVNIGGGDVIAADADQAGVAQSNPGGPRH